MAQSFQKEKPPARINLFLDVLKGNAKKKVELPLRMLVVGDFTQSQSKTPLGERDKTNINKDNFQQIMESSGLGVKINVTDRRKAGGGDMPVELKFKNLNSFHPEEIAKQVPQLSRMLATRNLLQDLRNRIISVADFRKQLETIVKNKEELAKLSGELEKLVPKETEGGEQRAEGLEQRAEG